VENYGVLTSILTHLIQHVGITPIVKNSDLRHNLTELRFHSICHRFGCFFLHDLDLTNGYLPGIQQKDNLQMLKHLGIKNPQIQKQVVEDQEDVTPSQDGLTWKELGELLNKGDERTRIKNFEWDPLWLTYSIARSLFCSFTFEYWFTLTATSFKPLPRPPQTLQEAMEVWTLPSIQERMGKDLHLILTPSVDSLEKHVPPKSRVQRFSLKRTSFFPEPGESLNRKSHWKPFFDTGFVKTYHNTIESSMDAGKEIKDALDCIFTHLQVLPLNPGKPGDVKPLWRWDGEGLKLLLNSSYIQLADNRIQFRGGVRRERRNAGPNKLKSKREVERMLAQKGSQQQSPRMTRAVQKSTTLEERQLRQGRRRGRGKNYRKPPTRQKHAVNKPSGSVESSSHHEQEEASVQKATSVEQIQQTDQLPPITYLEDEESSDEEEDDCGSEWEEE
jgi:hypothetical protein